MPIRVKQMFLDFAVQKNSHKKSLVYTFTYSKKSTPKDNDITLGHLLEKKTSYVNRI